MDVYTDAKVNEKHTLNVYTYKQIFLTDQDFEEVNQKSKEPYQKSKPLLPACEPVIPSNQKKLTP